jgi:hypothetical protein
VLFTTLFFCYIDGAADDDEDDDDGYGCANDALFKEHVH